MLVMISLAVRKFISSLDMYDLIQLNIYPTFNLNHEAM